MPKKRLPGHLQRRARRRRDATPNLPRELREPREPAQPVEARAKEPQPSLQPRSLRPTLRRTLAPGQPRPTQAPLEVDYSYVISDLKRIGLLTAGAAVVLGALTFVIQ